MTTRNLTHLFVRLRDESNRGHLRPLDMFTPPTLDALELPRDFAVASVQIEDASSALDAQLVGLARLYADRLLPRIGRDDTPLEKQVAEATSAIKMRLASAMALLRAMPVEGAHGEMASLMRNTQAKLTHRLNQFGERMGRMQCDYLRGLEAMRSRRQELNAGYEPDDGLSRAERHRLEELADTIYAKGFTDAQAQTVMQNQRDIIMRDRELRGILSSIGELQSLFKQLGEMVVQQDDVLNRVDYNLEHAEVDVDYGTRDLETAQKTQGQCSWVTGLLICVLVVTLMLTVVLALRLSLLLNR